MIPVKYENLNEKFPLITELFINELRSSSSEYKDTPIEKIVWAYRFGFFNKKGTSAPDVKPINMVYEERLNYELSKIRVDVIMTAKSYLRGDRVINNPENLPEEVYNFTREFIKVKMTVEQEESEEATEVVKNSIPPLEDSMKSVGLPTDSTNAEKKQKLKSFEKEEALDSLLDKLSDLGYDALSEEEKKKLNDLSI